MSSKDARPNRPATISANAQLMNNYTTPSDPLGQWSIFTVGHQVGKEGKTQIHLYGVPRDNEYEVYHAYKNLASPTGWSQELLKLPQSNLWVQQIVCGMDPHGNKSVVFIKAKDTSSKEYKVFYNRDQSKWKQVGKFPDGVDFKYLSTGIINNELVLMASYFDPGNSKIQQIDWKNNAQNWIDFSDAENKIYCINVGPGRNGESEITEGVWASVKYTNDHRKLKYFDSSSKGGKSLNFDEAQSLYAQVQAPPTASKDYGEAFGMTDQGKLYDVIDGKGIRMFEHQSKIVDFTVVQPNLKFTIDQVTFKDQDWHAFAVNNKKQLLHSYTSPGSSNDWSEVIPFMDKVIQLQSVVTKDFVSVFVMNTSGEIIELQREAMTSEWRKVPIYVPKKLDTHTIENIDQLAVGNSQNNENGIPAFQIGTINGDGYTGLLSESSTTPQNVYLPKNWEVIDGDGDTIQIAQIISAPDIDGQTVYFVRDENQKIYYRRVENTSWRYLYSLDGDDDFKIVAGIMEVDDKKRLHLFASRNNSGKSKIIELDWESTFEDHCEANDMTDKFDRIYDFSIGKTSSYVGLFASIQDNDDDNKYSVQFFKYGHNSPKEKYSSTDSHHYRAVYGVNIPDRAKDEVIFLDYDNKLYYQPYKSSNTKIAENIAEAQVCLSKDQDSKDLTVFATDENNEAYHFWQSGEWKSEKIAKDIAHLSLGSNPWTARWQQCFAVRTDNKLARLEEDNWEDDYQGEKIYEITDNDLDTPVEFESYVSQVTIGDLNGVGIPEQAVYFLPLDDTTRVDVNGIEYFLSPNDKPLKVITDGNGRASFTVIATNLHTSQMKVWADFMEDDKCLVVQPNKQIQKYLAEIDKSELQDAQKQGPDGTTSNLFEDPDVVDEHFVESVNSVMEMSLPSDEISRGVDLSDIISPRCNRKLVHYTTHDRAQELTLLNAEHMGDRHFQIEFAPNGRVKFHQLTAELAEVAHANAEKGIMGHPALGTRRVASSDPVYDIDTSFGDVFASINNDLSTDYCDCINISTVDVPREHERGVFKRVKATVNFVKDEATYVWKGFINLIEDTFDVLQSIFAHAKVFFRDLFEWLGDFFCWQDVLNTQTAVLEMFDDVITQLPAAIRGGGALFSDLKQDMSIQEPQGTLPDDDIFQTTHNDGIGDGNEANAKYGDPGMVGEDEAYQPNDDDKQYYGDSPQGNWLSTQVSNAFSRVDTSVSITEQMEAAVLKFLEEIKDIIDISEIASALQPLADLMNDKEGDAKITETISTAMEAVGAALQNMLVQVLEAGKDLFAIIIEQLPVMLNSHIDIPLLTPLYEKIITNGQRLTFLNLVALMTSLPATIGYKLFMLMNEGTAYPPFVATENKIQNGNYQISLEAFSDHIESSKGVMPQAMIASVNDQPFQMDARMDNSDAEKSRILSQVFGFVYSFAYMFTGAYDFIGIRRNLTKAPNQNEIPDISLTDEITKRLRANDSFEIMKMNSSIIAQSVSCPWYVSYDKFPEKGSTERIDFIIWCCQWTLNILDVCGLVCELKNKKAGAKVVSGLTSLAGLAHMGAFIYLAVEESKKLKKSKHKTYDRVDLGLKTSQNILTSLGESLELPKSLFLDSYMVVPSDKIIAAGVYDLLSYESVFVLNLARTITNLACSDVDEKLLDV